ncbi:hypothetical protein CW304_29605 [Bacillus sp. UFRGS-B20]|nr:hypothetical protein CW304_29605 [Bacillus sp. UFRGS-B20]
MAGGDSSSNREGKFVFPLIGKLEKVQRQMPSGTMYMQGSNPWPLIASKLHFPLKLKRQIFGCNHD